MIKLFSLKQQKKDGDQTTKQGTQKKASAAQLRIQKGILCFYNGTIVVCWINIIINQFYIFFCIFHTNCLFIDINELNLPKTCNTEFPDPDDLLIFKLIICPDEGFYKGGRFVFHFKVKGFFLSLIRTFCNCFSSFIFINQQAGPNYPHEPPKVKCETQVYHPNIDLEGNVCLNILREDWKPVLTVNSIVYGLQYLFLVSSF